MSLFPPGSGGGGVETDTIKEDELWENNFWAIWFVYSKSRSNKLRIHLWEMSYDDKEVRNMYVASSSNGKLLIVLPEKVAQLPQECLLINQETGEKVSHEEIFIRGDTLQVQYRGLKKGSYSLQVNDVLTESGLFLSDTLLVTTSSYAEKGDVLISEYMADPTPAPTNKEYPEYLELYNRRDSIVKLDDCFLEKNTSQYSLSHITIPAHDYVVIALERDSSSFIASSFRSVPSMPSLNNSGFQINLRCSGGKMIDSIVYSPKDYSGDKRVGGWSLERTYLGKACYPLPVWQFSSHASGGTPGQSNSVSMPLEKLPPPELILKTKEDSCFSFSTNRPIDFSPSDWVTLTHNKKPALFHKQRISDTSFRLCLNKKPANFQIHRFYLSGLKDKCRNAFPVFSFSQQMATPLPRMLIISEIMFAPSTLESEYIEIHNLSEHTLNLSETSIAGKKEDGSISHVRRLSDSTYMLPAQKSIVLHDGEWVGYGVIPEHLLALTSLPPLNNDSGHLVLLGKGNNILDETDYHARWHSLWLKDKGKGVSLERCINDNGGKERDDFGSWYSTSLNNGKRGTPGSFSRLSCLQLFDASYSLSIDIEPEYIELDRSNLPVLFHCQTAKEQLATFYLLNSEGILEKELFRNITLLGKSTLQWNNIEGITAGIYVLHVVIKDEIGIVKTINKALYFR